MATVYKGKSSNGKDIVMSINGLAIRMTHLANLPIRSSFYVVLRTVDGYVGKKANELVAFDFDGDIGNMSGNYTVLSSSDEQMVLSEYRSNYGEEEETPSYQEEPSYEEEEEQETSHSTYYEEDDDEEPPYFPARQTRGGSSGGGLNSGGQGWTNLRNVMYILGIIFGFIMAIAPVILIFILVLKVIPESGSGTVPQGIQALIFLWGAISPFLILSPIGCIVAFKNRQDNFQVSHNASMVFGFVNLNLFAILGGWCNYRYRVHRNKIKPAKE